MPLAPTAQPIAITMGDAAGIGPEIIAKAFRLEAHAMQGCFVAGDVQTMRRASAAVTSDRGLALPVAVLTAPDQAADVPPNCIAVLQVGTALASVATGAISPVAGEFAGRCVLWATDAALRGDVAAIVTAPLHKGALSAAGAPYHQYPGHTEMLQAQTAKYLGKPVDQIPVRMMLANDELRTVLVSIHMSLRHAIDAVTYDNVLQTLLITHSSLSRLLGRTPRIAVAGLNPHAGEGGLFGREEARVIYPAIEAARAQGCTVTGPFAPETLFLRARNAKGLTGEFDLLVAMYHPQRLIPVKYLGVDKGVNVTLGLPFVRASPDHGTAFDIAGTGKADASSLLAAVHMARLLSSG